MARLVHATPAGVSGGGPPAPANAAYVINGVVPATLPNAISLQAPPVGTDVGASATRFDEGFFSRMDIDYGGVPILDALVVNHQQNSITGSAGVFTSGSPTDVFVAVGGETTGLTVIQSTGLTIAALIDSSSGLSVTFGAGGFAGDFTGPVRVTGKLTITGLIDPTGLVVSEQTTVPGGAPGAGNATWWARDDVPNVPMFTDDAGVDHVLGFLSGITRQGAYDGGPAVVVTSAGGIPINAVADQAAVVPAMGGRLVIIAVDPTADTQIFSASLSDSGAFSREVIFYYADISNGTGNTNRVGFSTFNGMIGGGTEHTGFRDRWIYQQSGTAHTSRSFYADITFNSDAVGTNLYHGYDYSPTVGASGAPDRMAAVKAQYTNSAGGAVAEHYGVVIEDHVGVVAVVEIGGHFTGATAAIQVGTGTLSGGLTATGRWFEDGDLALGAAAMIGTERLFVSGSSLLDGNVDINGNNIIIDSDGNTQILGGTNDRIDFQMGGITFVSFSATGVAIGGTSFSGMLQLREVVAGTTPQLNITQGGTGDAAIKLGAGATNLVFGVDNSVIGDPIRFEIGAVLGAGTLWMQVVSASGAVSFQNEVTVNAALIVAEDSTTITTAAFSKNVAAASNPVVDVIQDSLTGAIECMRLQQDDVSEGFFEFVGSDLGSVNQNVSSTESVRVRGPGGGIFLLALYPNV